MNTVEDLRPCGGRFTALGQGICFLHGNLLHGRFFASGGTPINIQRVTHYVKLAVHLGKGNISALHLVIRNAHALGHRAITNEQVQRITLTPNV